MRAVVDQAASLVCAIRVSLPSTLIEVVRGVAGDRVQDTGE